MNIMGNIFTSLLANHYPFFASNKTNDYNNQPYSVQLHSNLFSHTDEESMTRKIMILDVFNDILQIIRLKGSFSK